MAIEKILTDVLAQADGEIVGRVRLQKIFYLLDSLGLDSGLTYDYHHFGPYSDELSNHLLYSIFEGDIEEVSKARIADGAQYSIFKLKDSPPVGDFVGSFEAARAKELIQTLKHQNATVLELASTIHWLKVHEHMDDWSDELKTRKGQKVTAERLTRAVELLDQVGLPH